MSTGEANLQAALDCEEQVRSLIDEGTKSFSIETVLSTDKYKEIVDLALAKGFGVFFAYVLLGSADEAIARVARRVARGGHDIPAAKIRDGWPRSIANLTWFWKRATKAVVLFNGNRVDAPFLVAARSEHSTRVEPDAFALLLPEGGAE